MYCHFPAKGDIKMSIGLFLKHIESSCEGNDFLDAVKFRFPIFFPVRVKKGSIINVGVRKYSFLTPFLHKKVDIDGIHSYN